MSFEGQTWAWKQECPTPNSRLVLLYLAMRADDETGYCYPGQKTIARETGLSEDRLPLPGDTARGPGVRCRSFPWRWARARACSSAG